MLTGTGLACLQELHFASLRYCTEFCLLLCPEEGRGLGTHLSDTASPCSSLRSISRISSSVYSSFTRSSASSLSTARSCAVVLASSTVTASWRRKGCFWGPAYLLGHTGEQTPPFPATHCSPCANSSVSTNLYKSSKCEYVCITNSVSGSGLVY